MSAQASVSHSAPHHHGLSVGSFSSPSSAPFPLSSPHDPSYVSQNPTTNQRRMACPYCPLEGLSVDRWAVHLTTRHAHEEARCPMCPLEEQEELSPHELRSHLNEEHGLRLPVRRERHASSASSFLIGSNRWRQARRSHDAMWGYLSRVGVSHKRRRPQVACSMCRKGVEETDEETAAVWMYECTHLVHQRCALSRSTSRSASRGPSGCQACQALERGEPESQPPRKIARYPSSDV